MTGPPRNRTLAWGALLVALTILVYLPVLRAGYIWDDDSYVVNNSTLRTLEGLRRIWLDPRALPQYYPLVHTTFWVEYHLWDLKPTGYHLVNVCLHAASALLLWRVLRRLSVPGAWLAASVFALHPVQVESVAWITERKNVLSTLLYLAAMACFLCLYLREEARRWILYALGSLLFGAALLSKTVTCSLPAALLLLIWWKRDRLAPRDLVPLLPLFVAGAALGLTTAWIEKHHVGAEGDPWSLTLLDRCLIAGRALWFYAGKLLWPRNLTFIYPRWEIDSGVWWQLLFPLTAAGTMVALWILRRRLGKAPLVAALFFTGTLTPALGFFDVFPMKYSFVADHFQYLACVGPIALFCALGTTVSRRLGPRWRSMGPAAGAGVLVALGILSWRQAGIYRDAETLWRDTLAKNAGAWMAHTNLGLILVRDGRIEEGMEHYRESVRLKPELVEPRLNLAELLLKQGKVEEAIALQTEAVRLQPGHVLARYNLGTALGKRGRYGEAIAQLSETLRLRPDFAEAEYNLATALLKLGRLDEAAAHYMQTLRIRPDHANAHTNLAHILETRGMSEEAAAHRREALRIKAWNLATHEDPQFRNGAQAVRLAEQAAETGGEEARVLDTLAAAYAEAGRFEEAVTAARKALELAESSGQGHMAPAIRDRLESYRAGRPFRDSSTLGAPGAPPVGYEKGSAP